VPRVHFDKTSPHRNARRKSSRTLELWHKDPPSLSVCPLSCIYLKASAIRRSHEGRLVSRNIQEPRLLSSKSTPQCAYLKSISSICLTLLLSENFVACSYLKSSANPEAIKHASSVDKSGRHVFRFENFVHPGNAFRTMKLLHRQHAVTQESREEVRDVASTVLDKEEFLSMEEPEMTLAVEMEVPITPEAFLEVGSGFWVLSFGFWVSSFGYRVPGFGFRGLGSRSGFWDLDLGFWVVGFIDLRSDLVLRPLRPLM
jgi:hypothetical protein